MNTANFIITKDKATARKLEQMGLKKITTNASGDVFINNRACFSGDDIDKTKIVFSNIIAM